MAGGKKDRRGRRGWRSVALVTGCLAVMAGAGYWIRSNMLPRADAQAPIPAGQPAAAPTFPAAHTSSDYSRRVVAYLYESEPLSREQFGDYLIERHTEKLELLIHKRIIDDACRQYNIEVSGSEIETALAEQLQGFAIDQKTFVSALLARYHKNLYEWKEDVVRARLQLGKLCRSRVQVSEEDLHKAFESVYGEKIECQIILWPKQGGKDEALADYAQLRDSTEAFDRKAKSQKVKPELAATAGKVRPFGRYVMGDDNFDRIVFRLKPNEVSEVFETSDGPMVVKCLRCLPADTSVRFESVRDKLAKELIEKKIAGQIQTAFDTLKSQANPKTFIRKKNKAEDSDGLSPCDPVQRSRQVVAVYNGQTPITREDFGEFLIARYGAEQIDFLINRRIIDKECQARGISVTPAEIEAGLADDLKKMGGIDMKVFEKDILGPYNKSVYEWREDVVRPRLLMAKLCRDRVKVAEEDLRQAFDSEYGEKLEGRMILWPTDQTRYAMMQYTRIRDNSAAFDEMAQHQSSSTLAAKGGKIGPFGRGSLGNKDVEDEAYKLHPGEMTTLLETPEGNVVFKLDKRHPANKTVALASVRDKLSAEVFEQKVQREMQTAFKDLRDKAQPRIMIKDVHKPSNLVETTKKLLGHSPDKLPAEARPSP